MPSLIDCSYECVEADKVIVQEESGEKQKVDDPLQAVCQDTGQWAEPDVTEMSCGQYTK